MLATKVLQLCLVAGFSTAVLAQESGDPRRGLAFAQSVCASCHAVLPAQYFSPRSGVATFKAIANTPGMTGTAISVWLRTPHRSMPDLIIEPQDQNDVIAYILTLREKGPTK